MADIELKKRTDPRSVITLLKLVRDADIDLKTIEMAKTEKHLRELSSMPLSLFMSQKNEFEAMKKLSRELLKQWADMRRKSLMELEKGENGF